MEPIEAEVKTTELFSTLATVEEVVFSEIHRQYYITLEGIGARFWVKPAIALQEGDQVKLMFHKVNKDD